MISDADGYVTAWAALSHHAPTGALLRATMPLCTAALSASPTNSNDLASQDFRRLFLGESAEEAQLNHLRHAGAERRQPYERAVECDQRVRTFGHRYLNVVEVDVPHVTAASRRTVSARVVNEDLAHRARGQGQEVVAILPLDTLGVDELEVGLVHEGGGGDRAALAVAAKVCMRDVTQPVVDDGKEPLQRLRATIPRVEKELCDFGGTAGRTGDVRIQTQVALLGVGRTAMSAKVTRKLTFTQARYRR